jgi:integrase
VISGKSAGKWRVQFTHEDEFGRKTRLSRLFSTKTEGKDFLRDLRRGVHVENIQHKKELTLEGWFDWLVANDWQESLAETTIAARICRFNKYVRKEWGGVALMRLDSLAFKAFYRKLQEDGVGQPTVLELKRDLVRVFNLAIKPYHRVPCSCGNPFALHVATPPRRDAVALTPEEAIKAIHTKTLSTKEGAKLATFLLAGVRLSEQMALTREQLLFEKNLIAIDRAVKFNSKRGQTLGLPKGNKTRMAVMCPTLKTILCEAFGDLSGSDLLWPCDDKNQPRLKRNVYRTWAMIVEKTELPPDMSPHDCRLTHINWIEKLLPDVSPTTLKEHVGHAASGVTEVNYTRPLTPAQDILRSGLESLINPKPATRKKRANSIELAKNR